jgi:hypothetical protein
MKSYRKPVESLEERRMFTTIKGNNTGIIAASDGTKENANNVVLTFDQEVKSVDASKIRLYSYAVNTIIGGQAKVTIPITSATASGKTVTIVTGAQVRKGAYLKLNAGAVKDTANADATGDIRLKKGLNKDRFTLAMRAYNVSDKSYFSSSVVSGGRTATTANVAESDAAVRDQLDKFLTAKVKNKFINDAQKADALAKYDNTTNKSIIGAHNLRAAVVSLVGTAGEPAINVFLGTGNTTGKVPIFVGFNSADIGAGAKDAELAYNTKGRLKLTFANDYAGEPFAALSGRIAHEALHDGGAASNVDSQDEEVVANFVESSVWAQQIVADFTQSQKGTKYTTYANYHLYTLLNSGDRQFPRVGLTSAPLKSGTTNATPGFINSYRSFDDLIRKELAGRISDKAPTPITAVTATILNKVGGGKYTAASTTFGDDLIASLDQTQGVLGDSFANRAARVLQVKVF